MMEKNITRRAVLAGAGATASSAALAIAIVPAVTADEVCALPVDPEIDGLVGLPLAAIHIERAIAAMADPGWVRGHWAVTIRSGEPNQSWGFRNTNPNRDPVVRAIADYQAGLVAYSASGIPDRLNFSDEEYDVAVASTYGPTLEIIKNWSAPAVTHEGALAALRFAVAEASDYACADTILPMLSSALAYFEHQA